MLKLINGLTKLAVAGLLSLLSLGYSLADESQPRAEVQQRASSESLAIAYLGSESKGDPLGPNLRQAMALAVEQLNEAGGILAKTVTVRAISIDGADGLTLSSVEQALAEGVRYFIGGFEQRYRRDVEALMSKHEAILFYLLPHDGIELADNTVSLGPSQNQQLITALNYFTRRDYQKIAIVGMPSIVSAVSVQSAKDHLIYKGLEVKVFNLKSSPDSIHKVAQSLQSYQPDFIVNTLHGSKNLLFYSALREAGVFSQKSPMFSLYLSESQAASLFFNEAQGDYIAWSHFSRDHEGQYLESTRLYKEKYGAEATLDDPMSMVFVALSLLKQSIEKVEAFDQPEKVLQALLGMRIESSAGTVYVDNNNRQLWRKMSVSQIYPDGYPEKIWSSQSVIPPYLWHTNKNRREWSLFAQDRYIQWRGAWERVQ